jgi:hypothetical protein
MITVGRLICSPKESPVTDASLAEPASENSSPVSFSESSKAISCEDEFLAALRKRQEAVGITSESLDAVLGLPDRYCNKLLLGQKPMGATSLWLILEGLGLRIRLVPDDAAVERIKRHGAFRPARGVRKTGVERLVAIARRRNAPWLWNSERARAAAMMRWHRPAVEEIAG